MAKLSLQQRLNTLTARLQPYGYFFELQRNGLYRLYFCTKRVIAKKWLDERELTQACTLIEQDKITQLLSND